MCSSQKVSYLVGVAKKEVVEIPSWYVIFVTLSFDIEGLCM